MSTYWYLYCRTCKAGDAERVGYWNHGVDRGLRDIIKMLPSLAKIGDLNESAFVEIRLTGPENTSGIIDFAVAHASHEVVCKNEYGAYDDRCAAWFYCSGEGCGRALSCTLVKDHDGEHRRTEA